MAAAILVLAGLHARPALACPDAAARRLAHAEAVAATQALDASPADGEAARVDALWRRVLEDAQACAGSHGQAAVAEALSGWASASRALGDIDAQYRLQSERLALASRNGLDAHRADALARLGSMLIDRGEIDLARQRLEEARASFEQIGDLLQVANVHSELSRLDRRVGEYLSALREELASLALRRGLPGTPDLWRSLWNIAVLYEQIELFDESRRRYAEALAEAERAGDPVDIGRVLNSYAGFLNDFGAADAPQALAMAERALAIHMQDSDRARIGSCLLQVGRAHMNMDRYPAADAAMAEAMRHARESGSRALQAHIQFRRGELAMLQGDADRALALVTEAREEYERQGNRHRLIKVHGLLERLHAQRGEELLSVRSGREHYRLRNELLGASATGKLGDLLNNFMLGEERLRNERLRQANALGEATLRGERRLRLAMFAVVAAIALALLLLGWRYVSTRRLYGLLHQKSEQVLAQGRELERVNAELTEQSRELLARNQTDALTRVGSRSHGMQRLAQMLERRAEMGTRPAVLLIDVDHFKSINDRYGHPAGDQVLVAVAAELRDALPADAEISRIGGEEFLVLLHDGPESRPVVLADALRRRVRDHQVDIGPCTVQVTVSIGVCHVPERRDTSARDVLAEVDRALYAAKRGGRDCVRVA